MKKPYITLLSVIASFAVVVLHCNGISLIYEQEPHWFLGNAIENLFYFAVPVFFMITGTTLLDFYERYSIKDYFIKRINKTLVPYLFFSIVGLLYELFVIKIIPLEKVGIKFLVGNLMIGNLPPVYWFFIPLFCIYLSIPIFAAIPRADKMKVFPIAIIFGLLFNCTLPLLVKLLHITVSIPLYMYAASGYLIYLFLGYYIANHSFSKSGKLAIIIAGLCGIGIQLFGTYYLSLKAGTLIDTFKGYLNIPCVVYSCMIFLLAKEYGNKVMEKCRTLFSFLGKYTMAVYLLHWFVMSSLGLLFNFDVTSVLYRLLMPFAVYALSVGIAFVVRKIPFGIKILPE